MEGPWEYGQRNVQGKRTDLITVKKAIDEGVTKRQLWEDYFPTMTRNYKALNEYKRISTRPRQEITRILILFGPSRVGKSRLARQLYPNAYWKPQNKWWDDYDQEDTVVWDEFRGEYQYGHLLRVLDSTPLILEIKGASVQFTSKLVVFTTNIHPSSWYNTDKINPTNWIGSPLQRRIEEYGEIRDMTPPGFLSLQPNGTLGRSNNYVPATPPPAFVQTTANTNCPPPDVEDEVPEDLSASLDRLFGLQEGPEEQQWNITMPAGELFEGQEVFNDGFGDLFLQ